MGLDSLRRKWLGTLRDKEVGGLVDQRGGTPWSTNGAGRSGRDQGWPVEE